MNNDLTKIGILSLYSDMGHVIPLLRIAASFAENGFAVTGYLPDENQELAGQFQIPVKTFGRVLENIDKEFYSKLFKKPLFYNAFSGYIDVNRNLIHPLIVNLCRCLQTIKDLVQQDKPVLLIADNFLFNDFIVLLAASIDCRLVFHSSGGNYRFLSKQFIYHFGFNSFPVWFQNWVLKRGYFHNRRYELQEKNEVRFYWSYFKQTVLGLFPGIQADKIKPVFIATGIASIEKEKIGTKIEHDDFLLFPAIKDRRKTEIPPDLLSWLMHESQKPVVYVSFGTVLKSNLKMMKSILRGLKNLNVRVLWIVPEDQRAVLNKIGLPADFRLESFVPQPQIFNRNFIKCFITHGGAGGVQEGLLAGIPMLCIPIMTDEPFNSSVVQRLGTGIKIPKQLAYSFIIKNKVKKLLKDQKYRENALKLKKELVVRDGGMELIRFLMKNGLPPAEDAIKSERKDR